MRSTYRPLQKIWSPFYVATWFALASSGRHCDICLPYMFFCLFEFMFILHSVYFYISKIIFCSKHKKKKCKVLEIISYDLNKNCCEIIDFVCLQMFFNVAMRNVAIGGDEDVLHIIEGMQTTNINVSDEEGTRGSKGEDNS